MDGEGGEEKRQEDEPQDHCNINANNSLKVKKKDNAKADEISGLSRLQVKANFQDCIRGSNQMTYFQTFKSHPNSMTCSLPKLEQMESTLETLFLYPLTHE